MGVEVGFDRQQERLKKWSEAEGIFFESEEAKFQYKRRTERFVRAVILQLPDRVPVFLPMGVSFPAYYCGITLKQMMYDYDALEKAWLKVAREFDMDTFGPPVLVHPARVFELIGCRYWVWPGNGLPDDSEIYQYVEDEYLYADEYDELLKDPTDFFLRKLLPRTCSKLSGLKKLKTPKCFLFDPALLVFNLVEDEIQEALETLIDSIRECRIWLQKITKIAEELVQMGYPRLWELIATAPFDFLGDTLRGTKGIFLDMYRQPSKLMEVLDLCADLIIQRIIESSENVIAPFVFIPLHKGYDGFMSPQQYQIFYWPGLKKILCGLINNGLIPWVFAEGNYNQRIELIADDLPKGYMVWHFEHVDMKKAKEILGKKVCIAGNLSPLLVQNGTPEEVERECRILIETCKEGGGYILAGGASVNKAKPENMRAIMKTAEKYGKYIS